MAATAPQNGHEHKNQPSLGGPSLGYRQCSLSPPEKPGVQKSITFKSLLWRNPIEVFLAFDHGFLVGQTQVSAEHVMHPNQASEVLLVLRLEPPVARQWIVRLALVVERITES